MATAGRFAVGAQFELVRNFFNDPALTTGTYTKDQITDRYNINKAFFAMQQKDYADSTNDYAARTYIWNSMTFTVNKEALFKVDTNGAKTVTNFSVSAFSFATDGITPLPQDNFDFTSTSDNSIGNTILEGWIDPSGIGRKVNLEFTGTMPTTTYTQAMYQADVTKVQTWTSPANTPNSTTTYNAMKGVAQDLFDSGTTKYLDSSQRIISYGSHEENDNLTPFSSLNEFLSPYQNKGNVLFGGNGKDILYSSPNNDLLMGGSGGDSYFFIGTFGNDVVKDTGKGDNIYINDALVTGKAYETAAGSGIYTLDDTGTITKAGNGIKLTTAGGSITLQNWSEGGYGLSLIDKEEQQQRMTQGPSMWTINGSVPLRDGTTAALRYQLPADDPAMTEMVFKILAAMTLSGAGLYNAYVADTELEAALFSDYYTPLVFDLDGDGVMRDLLPAHWAFGRFDLNNDGYAEASGWVKPDDGFLVRDVNGNGVIDNITEMFGSYGGQTAWQQLSMLDSTNDGKITNADSLWNSLKIWRDVNINNYSEANELVSLTSVGIYGISTAKENYTQAPADSTGYNQIDGKGVWLNAQGQVGGEYMDVLFKANKQFTTYVGNNMTANLAITPAIAALPELGNLANVPFLHYAASQNPRIASLLTMLDTSDPSIAWSESAKVVGSLLIEWAGNASINPGSLGPYIDARIAQTLRELSGLEPYTQPLNSIIAADALKNWDALVNKMQQRLMAQAYDEIFPNAYYDYTDNWVKTQDNTADIVLNARTLQPEGLMDKLNYWQNITRLIQSDQFDMPISPLLSHVEVAAMNSAGIFVSGGTATEDPQTYYAFAPTQTNYSVANTVATLRIPLFVTGNALNNVISTSNKNDFIDGVSGNDTIDGRDGTDVMTFSGANGINVNFNTKIATYGGFTSSFANIEGVIGSAGNDSLTGSNGSGNASTKYLIGLGGNDTIISGLGSSNTTFIDGGAGKDIITMNGGGVIVFSSVTDSSSVGNMQDIISGYDPLKTSINVESLGYIGITDNPFYARPGLLFSSYNAATNTTSVSDKFWSSFEFKLNGAFTASQLNIQFSKINDLSTVDRSFYDTIGSPDSELIGADVGYYTSLTSPQGSVLVGIGGHDTVRGGIGNDTIYIKDTFEAAPDPEEQAPYSFVSPGDGDDIIIINGNGNVKINASEGNDTYIINGTGTISFWKDGHDWTGDTFYLGDEAIAAGSYFRPSTTVNSHSNYLYNIGQGFVGEYDNDFLRVYKEANTSPNIFIEHAPYTWNQTNELGMSFVTNNNVPAFGGGKIGTITQNTREAWVDNVGNNLNYSTQTMASLLKISPLSQPVAKGSHSAGKAIISDDLYPLTLGTDGKDTITGSSNADTVFGAQGNDSILGANGADMLYGGAGNDTIVGDYGADTIYGDTGNDWLYGGWGNDSLLGGDGADLLDGGQENDLLAGGTGADIFRFSDVSHSVLGLEDRITDFQMQDKIDLSAIPVNRLEFTNTTSTAGAARVMLWNDGTTDNTYITNHQLGFEVRLNGNVISQLSTANVLFGAPSLHGTNGNDTINGSSVAERVVGYAGNDSLLGGTGNDTLFGGTGADTIVGDNGADSVLGEAGNDWLYGGWGNDSLLGGDGADLLDGGQERDVLTGGAGMDTFRFSVLTHSISGAEDRITDFQQGIDKINVRGLGFTAFDSDGGATESGELRFVKTGNVTTVISDQTAFAFQVNLVELTNSDFIF